MLLLSYLRIHCTPNPQSSGLIPMLSSESFLVIAPILNSLIHFELNFVYDVICIYYIKEDVTLFFCLWISSFPSTICWRDSSFPFESILVKNELTINVRVYSRLSVAFHWSVCLLLKTGCFEHFNMLILEIRFSLSSGIVFVTCWGLHHFTWWLSHYFYKVWFFVLCGLWISLPLSLQSASYLTDFFKCLDSSSPLWKNVFLFNFSNRCCWESCWSQRGPSNKEKYLLWLLREPPDPKIQNPKFLEDQIHSEHTGTAILSRNVGNSSHSHGGAKE